MAVPHHVLQTEPLPFLVQAGRVERSAVPADHARVLLVPRIEDLLQEVYEAIRAADILWRTPWVSPPSCRAPTSPTCKSPGGASARAQLEDVRIHDLRHTFASRALPLGRGCR